MSQGGTEVAMAPTSMNHDTAASTGDSRVDRLLTMMELAKIDVTKIEPETQQLTFCEPLLSDDFRLIQLDDHLLKEIEAGHRLCPDSSLAFRGGAEEEPILCSERTSYSVKDAEQSNCMLLAPECRLHGAIQCGNGPKTLTDCQVVCMKSSYLELKARDVIPRARLTDRLQSAVYGGPKGEISKGNYGFNCFGFTIDEILNDVQMSRDELMTALRALPVCCIDDAYRWLEFDYRSAFLSDVIDAFDSENGPDLRQFTADTLEKIVNTEQAYPDPVFDHLLSLFADKTDDQYYSVNEWRVSQFLAHVILRPTQRFNYDDFMKLWTETAPSGVEPKLEHLKALALVEQDYRMKTIEYFPIDELPENVEKRFKILFTRRARWTYDDLQAYLTDVAATNKQIGSLITKYSRSSTVDGVRYYNAR